MKYRKQFPQKFPQHNINQTETGISDKKLPVEPVCKGNYLFFWKCYD